MDLLEFALTMEKQTIQNYKSLAEQCTPHEGIRRILLMLAEDHEKHVLTLTQMRDKSFRDIEVSNAFKEADKLFTKMRNEKETFSCEMDQLQLYRNARELMQNKYEVYKEMLAKIDSDPSRKLLQDLMAEEIKQLKVLDNIIEMVSRPQHWLDNAEFFHLEEY